MSAHVGWTQQKVDALPAVEAARLRSDLAAQSMSASASERSDAFGLLRMLGARSDGSRSAEERAKDAAAFLYPAAASASTRQRAYQAAVHLYGEKQAARRFPDQAAS